MNRLSKEYTVTIKKRFVKKNSKINSYALYTMLINDALFQDKFYKYRGAFKSKYADINFESFSIKTIDSGLRIVYNSETRCNMLEESYFKNICSEIKEIIKKNMIFNVEECGHVENIESNAFLRLP